MSTEREGPRRSAGLCPSTAGNAAEHPQRGAPPKQYEPFFSDTEGYEDEDDLVQWGVTPIIRYDSIDRVIRTDLPDGTFTKVEFDAWSQSDFDQNESVGSVQ